VGTQKPLSAPRFYCPTYRPFITISLTPLSVARAQGGAVFGDQLDLIRALCHPRRDESRGIVR
jgi:hypothetical protein